MTKRLILTRIEIWPFGMDLSKIPGHEACAARALEIARSYGESNVERVEHLIKSTVFLRPDSCLFFEQYAAGRLALTDLSSGSITPIELGWIDKEYDSGGSFMKDEKARVWFFGRPLNPLELCGLKELGYQL